MRFFIDENSHLELAPLLSGLFHQHTFRTYLDEGLANTDDIPLFAELHARSFDAIVTDDKGQLRNTDERDALRGNQLHWIGHKRVGVAGLDGLALTISGVIAGMPFVLAHLDRRPRPYAFQLKGVPRDQTQRLRQEPL